MQRSLDMFHALDGRSKVALSDQANKLERSFFDGGRKEALLIAMTTLDTAKIEEELATLTKELGGGSVGGGSEDDEWAATDEFIHGQYYELAALILMAERILCENCCNPFKAPLDRAVIQRLTGEFANNANLNFDVLTALMPSNVGVQMMGATKESSEDESKRGSFSVMAMTRMIESVVQHPKVKKELVMPTMLRVVPESEIESEVVPAADISKSTGAAFKPEKRLSKLDAKPLKGPEATTTAFVPTEPKTETTDAHNPKAATTTAPMEAQKTRSLTEEEKVYLEIERVRRILFKMDIKELMEIRGYPNPPAGLEPLLKCNLVLLGHSEATLKSWADIKKKIQKAGSYKIEDGTG